MGVILGHSGISSTLGSRNRIGFGVEMSHHLLIPFLTVLHFTQDYYGNISRWHLCGVLWFEKLSHIFEAFDLYGILSYREELPVFEGEEGLAIIGIFLPVGSESTLYACFSIRLTLLLKVIYAFSDLRILRESRLNIGSSQWRVGLVDWPVRGQVSVAFMATTDHISILAAPPHDLVETLNWCDIGEQLYAILCL